MARRQLNALTQVRVLVCSMRDGAASNALAAAVMPAQATVAWLAALTQALLLTHHFIREGKEETRGCCLNRLLSA